MLKRVVWVAAGGGQWFWWYGVEVVGW